MKSSDQRRKRKRILRHPLSHLSVRSLLLCFSFLTFLYLLSHTLPFTSSAFRPVLVVSSLSLLSSSTAKSLHHWGSFSLPFEIEDRVLFPDHVLLLVGGGNRDVLMKDGELECVYFRKNDLITSYTHRNYNGDFTVQKVVSLDEYDEFRIIVRCPLSFGDYSAEVNLRRHGENWIFGEVKDHRSRLSNQTVGYRSWDNLVYAAALDGSTVVVFVKGLSLRANRDLDTSQLSCHFGLGKLGRRTKALRAAQEVVRCALPRSLQNNTDKVEGIRVTIGVQHQHQVHRHLLMPSLAKASNLVSFGVGKKVKYELCVCSMVWNQGSAMREWIMYHAWLGVERWFIYDNNSDDGTGEVVQELNHHKYNVSRHVWPWLKTQEEGFSHCALRAKDECNWISFMDVDEYFYFPYSTPKHQIFRKSGYAGHNSLRSLVVNVSSSSRAIAEIRTSCYSFGPSGLSSLPPQGVTVGYSCRLQSPERHKSIIRLDMH